jgi:hypothetical protein
VGLIEELDKLNLSDEEKAKLKSEYKNEFDPLKTELDTHKAKSKKDSVEEKIDNWGLSEFPGVAKKVRRYLLAPDAEEPGALLLSDAEMGLTGDKATGATTREEVSLASAITDIFDSMPRNQEGKLNLSDQALGVEDHGHPGNGEAESAEEKAESAKKRISKVTGKSVTRTGKRYGQEVTT